MGSESKDCREAFSRTLVEMAARDERIVAVVNDSVSSTRLKSFHTSFPRRFVNVGIAEQNMIGVGAGLANGGKIPFVCGASCFLTGRSLEQVKVDMAYSFRNVKLCGMSSGVAYGELGPTHHSIEDLAWTRAIAGMTVIVPADSVETGQAMLAIAEYDGPVFLRLSRMPVPDMHGPEYRFVIGKAEVLREGCDVSIVANGVMVCRALEAAEMLAAKGIEARVVNMSTLQPLDREVVLDCAVKTRGIVTVEEHSVRGGLGGAVAEVVVTAPRPVPMKILGIPGVFAPTGSAEFLLDHFGLNADGIRSAVEALAAQTRAGGR
ncbi:MAG: transketolase C-terminal domain-containing protein [Acidobacteriaceae bacterium]